jgi:N-acetyl-alpha-D-muramate 1-phosphate uridylyltransferase
VVNVHYFADAIEAHLARRAGDLNVNLSDERAKLLETGGGLMKAKSQLGEEAFFCVNTDNIWLDGPLNSLKMMAQRWDDATMDALMLLVPLARAHNHEGRGDFHMDGWGRLTRRKPGRVAPYVWTGVQILSPRVLVDPPADAFSTNVFWDRAIAAGRCFGMVHQGVWFDVGTPAAIPVTEAALADG